MKKSKIESMTGLLIGGGIVTSLISSVCCNGPLILTILGISGAAGLAKFETVRLPMIFTVMALFAIAGLTLYRKRKSCEPNSICADPKKYSSMVVFYWVGLMIAFLAMTSPSWVAWLFS